MLLVIIKQFHLSAYYHVLKNKRNCPINTFEDVELLRFEYKMLCLVIGDTAGGRSCITLPLNVNVKINCKIVDLVQK